MTEYLLRVWYTVADTWDKVKGAKATIWAALIIVILLTLLLNLVTYLTKASHGLNGVVSVISFIITYLLQTGLLYIGIKRAFDQPISFNMLFRSFEWKIAWRLILLYILSILIFIPIVIVMVLGFFAMSALFTGAVILGIILYIISIIAAIFIGVRISLATAFILDQVKGPWESIMLSFAATRHNFWRIALIFLIEIITIVVSMIPLLIGLIWTLPFATILYGLIYRRLSEKSN